ncbi:MAG: sigma 54-interacting transcriptional regulator [Gammaproteobacteria bacterium]
MNLLPVWREACRHIDIGESTANIARVVAMEIPAERLLVREFDRSHLGMETVAVGWTGVHRPWQPETATCAPAARDRLLERAVRSGASRRARDSALEDWLEPLLPSSCKGSVIVAPFATEGGAVGLLVAHAFPGLNFTAAHAGLVQALVEPFALALDNHHRLTELNALREAAEADKRSLLTRLGRKDLSETVVGADSGLRAVMERVALVRNSDVPVLILGETGTGKEVLAREIHAGSARASGPFIRVNCGAIPTELIDSELFGHEKGAFTGATSQRRGWFERADGGTLLMDEIGELPLPAQVRLLRVLQDGYIQRVGGEEPIKVDVRIVAATHRELPAMTRDGRFREDLWYRLAVFPITLPPLRERRYDIRALAAHFAARAATRFGFRQQMPTPAEIDLLEAYPWPGNVRELGAVIDRAVILGEGERLEVAAALGQPALRASQVAKPFEWNTPSPDGPSRTAHAPIETLDAAMRRHIERALAHTGGRIEGTQGTAALLGINPHTLRARMRKLGIAWSRFRAPP